MPTPKSKPKAEPAGVLVRLGRSTCFDRYCRHGLDLRRGDTGRLPEKVAKAELARVDDGGHPILERAR